MRPIFVFKEGDESLAQPRTKPVDAHFDDHARRTIGEQVVAKGIRLLLVLIF